MIAYGLVLEAQSFIDPFAHRSEVHKTLPDKVGTAGMNFSLLNAVLGGTITLVGYIPFDSVILFYGREFFLHSQRVSV